MWLNGAGPVLSTFRRAGVYDVGVCGVAVGGGTIFGEEHAHWPSTRVS